jgi:hypothetical protein
MMTAEPPAGTRMMGITHAAFRRDLPGRTRRERVGDIEASRDVQKTVLDLVTADSWSAS